ncbi:MAG: SlyX family protein [Deltaproteobacteria bacterium]|nr:SlyX family protein [Deltaproteobacteria bacterium]MDQ3300021.1 SlyX family protein [Myxococcota bacterium]
MTPSVTADHPPEWLVDVEVKLAYQERLIGELDALVRTFAARLEKAERAIVELREGAKSPEAPLGPANEPPPHY